MSFDNDVKRLAAEVDALLDQLRTNVDALTEILGRPSPPPEEQERLVSP